jgi:hypothetical protein
MKLHRHLGPWSWITAIAVGTGVVQLSAVAHAEEDSATETAAARTLAVDGLRLAQAGKCDEAVSKLERAEKLHHSVIVLSHLGECQVTAGNLVAGTEMLRKVLREPLPPNPTPALTKAYERAQAVFDMARPKIAGLTVSVSAPPETAIRITVDGLSVASTLLDSELPADPGDHVVEATASGFLKASARVTLAAADKRQVVLKLEVDPNAVLASTPNETPRTNASAAAAPPPFGTTPPSPALHADVAPRARGHAPSYLSWGIGVAGVGVGTVFGLMTLKAKQDLHCQGNTCLASQRDAVESAKRNGNISTIAFGIGGAGLLLGTVLYFSGGTDAESPSAAAPRGGFAGLKNGRALVGPGSVQLAADF